MDDFKYTEPVAIVLLFICLLLHVLGYNGTVDSILFGIVAFYLGIDLYKKAAK